MNQKEREVLKLEESFKDVIEDFVDGIKELNRIQMNLFNKEFIDYSTNLVSGLNEIFNFLQYTKYIDINVKKIIIKIFFDFFGSLLSSLLILYNLT